MSPPGSTGAMQDSPPAPRGGRTPTPRLPNGGRSPSSPRRASAARIGAAAALLAAIVVIVVLVFGRSSGYVVHVRFENASGLVTGDNVLIGPAVAGTVSSIGLTRDGQAAVTLTLHGTGSLHRGTVARIYEDSLSGIASKYVSLEPGPRSAPSIPSGGTIGLGHSFSSVNIDELLDSFNRATRHGLRNLIRGEATSLRGKGRLANQTLKYLAPGLESTSEVTRELARDEPAFDGLLVQGAEAMRRLASRSDELSRLIDNTSSATGAIASQSQALQTALQLLPGTLRRSTHAFAGLDSTLAALDPVVAAAKPASRQLPQFASGLQALSVRAIPTVRALNDLISNPDGGGDLTALALATPGLAAQAERAFPALIENFTKSRAQVDYLREYAPDVIAALGNVGQASAYYDANGHYTRTMPMLFPFTTDAMGQLVSQNPADRYNGLQRASSRCPGAAVQASPDGSTPRATQGCDTSEVPPGP